MKWNEQRRFLGGFLLASVLLAIAVEPCIAQTEKQLLEYKLNVDSSYEYEFNGKAEAEDGDDVFSGRIQISVDALNVERDLSGRPLETQFEGTSTSTAFGITPDGYMLTCAHCVDGAEKLMVKTPEGEVEATIIATDEDLDLAIIKVETKNLPTVSLGQSEKIELAQDVRAIGFPLSNVLGNSVKIARGAVSGFVDRRGGRMYQIDVAVNPGNSGGPLVDDFGNVVGVVNAKLEGISISKIGFSVPISFACKMLDRNKVKYDSTPKRKTMSGPELAKAITPAVFFVKAKLGPDGYKSLSNYKISAIGQIEKDGRVKSFRSRAIVNRDGILLDASNDENIPYVFSSVCELPFEMLPQTVVKKWGDKQSITLQMPNRSDYDDDIRDPFGMHRFHSRLLDRMHGPGEFGPRLPFDRPRSGRNSTIAVPGERRVSYETVGDMDGLVKIKRSEELRTLDATEDDKSLSFVNERKLHFDPAKGIFTSCEMTGALKVQVSGDSVNLPVTFSYKLVDTTAAKLQDSAAKVRETLKPNQLINDFITQKSLSENETLRVLNRLAQSKFDNVNREELLEAITVQANSSSTRIRKAAIEALLATDDASAIPFLAKELENANRFSMRSWVGKLAKIDHPESVVVLCEALRKNPSDKTLKAALIAMGEVAAKQVFDVFVEMQNDTVASNSVYEILAKIADENTRAKLQDLIKSGVWTPDESKNKSLESASESEDPFG